MKKSLFLSFAFLFTLTTFALPPQIHAADCNTKVVDVKDFSVEITKDINFRKTIQGAPDETCAESVTIGSLGVGKVVWVLGMIETSFVIDEATQELGAWYYLKHPTTGDYGYVWSAYTKKVDPPEGDTHVEEVVEMPEGTEVDPQNPTPTTPTTPATQTLKDVVGHAYEESIRYLEKKKIIEGFADGTYRPEASIDRAAFTKIVVGGKIGSNPTAAAADCFSDVLKDQWYASYVCFAKNNKIVSGHPSGAFMPGDPIKLVEAAKILVNTFGLEKDPETDVWYEVYIEALQRDGYIPDTFTALDQLVSRGQMAEMMARIMEKIHNKPSTTFPFNHSVVSALKACTDTHLGNSMSMKTVRDTFLALHNDARKSRNLPALALNDALNYSATVWAKQNEVEGKITHDRKDNQQPEDWFNSIGITFKKLNGFTFAENLGSTTYECTDTDCTDDVVAATQSLFEAFMDEEGTAVTGHFDNIVQPDYRQLGLGLAIDEDIKTLYLTAHYAQAVDASPNTCE